MSPERFDSEEVYSFDGHECRAYRLGSGEESIAIVTENHGDEKGPRKVVDEMLEAGELDYDELSLTVIQQTNTYASDATSRKTPLDVQKVEADEHDLNRMYGDAREVLQGERSMQELNTTGQLAYQVLDYIDDLDPDLVIDMHTGTSATVKMPQIRYRFREEFEEVKEDEMKAVAENAGVDMIRKVPDEDAQMMGAVLPKMGFPAVTVEVGGGVRLGWKGSFEEEEAESYRDIIRNILECRAGRNGSGYDPAEFTVIEKNHAPPEVSDAEVKYHFDLGEEVSEGETVATLRTGDGEEFEMDALSDGVVETLLAEGSRDKILHGNRVFNLAVR